MSIEPPKGAKFLEINSPQKIMQIWLTLNDIKGLFDDYTKNRPDLFRNLVVMPNTLWLEREDGNGLLYLTEIMPGLSANAHIVYWDRILSGKEDFTMDCLRWAITNCNLQKVNCFLPDYARSARHFARKLGFRREGVIRRYSIGNNRMFDMYIFGITREEAFSDGQLRTERDTGGNGEPVHAAVPGLDEGTPSPADGSSGHEPDGGDAP